MPADVQEDLPSDVDAVEEAKGPNLLVAIWPMVFVFFFFLRRDGPQVGDIACCTYIYNTHAH